MNTENIYLALQLMVVGMATVFLILYIIIGLGKLLVNYTNANAKEAPPVSPRLLKPMPLPRLSSSWPSRN